MAANPDGASRDRTDGLLAASQRRTETHMRDYWRAFTEGARGEPPEEEDSARVRFGSPSVRDVLWTFVPPAVVAVLVVAAILWRGT